MSGVGQTVTTILTGRLDTSGHVESDPVRVVAEQILIRLTSEQGSIFWDRDAGLGVLTFQNHDFARGELGRVESQARIEALRVPGVVSAKANATVTSGVLRIRVDAVLDSRQEIAVIVDSTGASEVLS